MPAPARTHERAPVAAPNRTRHLASIAAAAERLDVHPRTIRRRVSDGTITGYRIGRLVKVDLDEVERVLVQPIPAARRTAGAA